MLNDIEIKNLEDLCKENRLNVLKMVYNAQSGHLGGALSAVEIMTVLYNKVMKTCKKWGEGEDFENTNMLCDCVLSIPMHPYLKDEDIDFVADKIKEFFSGRK